MSKHGLNGLAEFDGSHDKICKNSIFILAQRKQPFRVSTPLVDYLNSDIVSFLSNFQAFSLMLSGSYYRSRYI